MLTTSRLTWCFVSLMAAACCGCISVPAQPPLPEWEYRYFYGEWGGPYPGKAVSEAVQVVTIFSEPPGARVYRNGELVGTTPVYVELAYDTCRAEERRSVKRKKHFYRVPWGGMVRGFTRLDATHDLPDETRDIPGLVPRSRKHRFLLAFEGYQRTPLMVTVPSEKTSSVCFLSEPDTSQPTLQGGPTVIVAPEVIRRGGIKTCPACSGRKWRPCGTCHGTGKFGEQFRDSSDPVKRRAGKDWKGPCVTCSGTGLLNKRCGTCSGRGVIEF